jgi:hypothetical protein
LYSAWRLCFPAPRLASARVPSCLATIRHQADASEAQDHHRPCGWLRNGRHARNGRNRICASITGTVTQNGTSFAITGLAPPPPERTERSDDARCISWRRVAIFSKRDLGLRYHFALAISAIKLREIRTLAAGCSARYVAGQLTGGRRRQPTAANHQLFRQLRSSARSEASCCAQSSLA